MQLGKPIDDFQLRVVVNLESSSNLCQEWEIKLSHLLVTDERKSLFNFGEVLASDGRDSGVSEIHATIDGLKRREGDGTSTSQSYIVAPDEVWERNSNVLGVESHGNGLTGILQVHRDIFEILVVVDLESFHSLEVNAVERCE